ncbi:hypothetical protein NL50_11940 [Clostridium acetobutylicum]|nr:hypothetical protein NL50_11940 [Clostridium acetobutylicum]
MAMKQEVAGLTGNSCRVCHGLEPGDGYSVILCRVCTYMKHQVQFTECPLLYVLSLDVR